MIAITGHTKGFGKYLFQRLHARGFSRSNGFDINDPQKIIESLDDCDIFINNAYDGFAQVKLLYALYEEWKDKNKLIINIGSRSKDFTLREREVSFGYSVEKLALEHASKQLSGTFSKCKITALHFGRMEEIGYDICYDYVQLAIKTKYNEHRLVDLHVSH